jgi:hypothetical protein
LSPETFSDSGDSNARCEFPNDAKCPSTNSVEIPLPAINESAAVFPSGLPLQFDVPTSQDVAKHNFVELCAGSAVMSQHVFEKGFAPMPIDWHGNKQRQRMSIVKLDMANANKISIFKDLAKTGLVSIVWAGIPCGTASKVREIPLADGSSGPTFTQR